MKRFAVIAGFLLAAGLAAFAQGPDDEVPAGESGFLMNFLENRISGPGRRIGLQGVTGALSSQARIERITVSDETGAWMVIDDVEIDWSRAQLLRARLQVNRLHIGEVRWLRRGVTPEPAPGLPTPESRPFTVPELPVSVELRDLALDRLVFDEAVFGMAAELSAGGNMVLSGGEVDTDFTVTRLDGPGGELDLKASFANSSRQLDVDLHLREPEGGVVATLLRIEGTPEIDLRMTGAGPIDNVDIALALDAGGARLAGGSIALRGSDEGLGFDADLRGGIAPLVPPDFRDFFAGETAIALRGVNKADGGLRIDRMDVTSAELALGGRLETGAGGSLHSLDLTGQLGDPGGPPVRLPIPGTDTRITSGTLRIDFGSASNWSGLVVLDRLDAGGIEMEDVTLTMGGHARNLEDAALRDVTIVLDGLATGVSADDPAVTAALGTRLDLFADLALVPGGSINIRQLQFGGNGLAAFASGRFAGGDFTGRTSLRAADIAVLEGFAGRPLGGALALQAEGSVTPLERAFDLTFDGSANNLALGDERLDRLLAGETTLGGRAVRDEEGFRTENLRLGNPQFAFASNGRIASDGADFGFDASLADLAMIDPRASGAVTARGRASGTGGPLALNFAAEIPSGSVMEREITDADLSFDGTYADGGLSGQITGGGSLDTLVLDLGATIAVAGESRSVTGLRLAVGANLLTGALAQDGQAPAVGQLTLNAPEIAPLAALALVEATGALDADITLSDSDPGQGIKAAGSAEGLAMGANRIGSLTFDIGVVDALGLPLLDGTLRGSDLTVAGYDIATLAIDAQNTSPEQMRISAQSRLVVGTEIETVAELERLPGGFSARLESLRVSQDALAARLTAPSTVTVQNGTVTLTPLALDLGQGTLTAQGSIAETIDASIDIAEVPLDLVNMLRPQLGLGGLVTGTARATGPRSAPDIHFDLTAAEFTSPQTVVTGLPPLTITAKGNTVADGRLAVSAAVAGQGLTAEVEGTTPLGAGEMDLAVRLQTFPLGLVDRLSGNRGLVGAVTGTAQVTGTYGGPAVTYDLDGTGVSIAMLRDNGMPPLNVRGSGDFRGGVITLAAAEVNGVPGLTITGSGRLPLQGPGVDLRLAGSVPLSIADPLLAGRLAQASGTLQLDLVLSGALTSLQYNGTLAMSDGVIVDPGTNVRMEQVRMDAAFSGTTLTFRSFGGNVGGGDVSGSGSIVIDGPRGFPADLSVQINEVRYTDGAFVTTTVSGDLNLNGPLMGGGTLSGQIDLGHTEISVSEALGAGAAATLEEVTHVRPPPRVAETLRRAAVGAPNPPQATGRSGLQLDLRIVARNQIFVRGRGLDVELGGELRITGPTTDIRPVGQFDLRRGRLDVIGQRIEFQEGSLQLVGDLDPRINFVARTTSGDVTAIVTVTGRASEPEIVFTSEPPLPQDEVLSHLLFNRASQNLSPFQAAQLAAAAAELAGRGGNGLLAQIRGSLGFDDLDIITNDDGEAALSAGRYFGEDVYVDVQAAADGKSKIELVYELNERLTARGSVGSDGNTTLGIFFERDF